MEIVMKRISVVFLVFLLLTIILASCGQSVDTKDAKISIVCSVFPQYDWARQILGNNIENVSLSLLQSGKADLHNYQPSVDDIIMISRADLFIYVGGESDKWVDDALRGASNPDMVVINLLDALGDNAKEEELLEGMEEDDDDEHDEHDDEGGAEYDEHVWLSLKNAEVYCIAIADALSALDTSNAGLYQGNLAAYCAKLSALDLEYQKAVTAAPINTLLFGDRFPFRYLMDDYNINCYAAFPGCSAETEASFETIVFLADKVDEFGLNAIMVTESGDQSIARTIISNTAAKNQQILALDAMQSVTQNDISAGTTFLSIMENNLNALKSALK